MPLFDLLIPNDLDDDEIAHYVSAKFAAFSRPGKDIAPLVGKSGQGAPETGEYAKITGVARGSASAGVQY
jgi:hypothetical protein